MHPARLALLLLAAACSGAPRDEPKPSSPSCDGSVTGNRTAKLDNCSALWSETSGGALIDFQGKPVDGSGVANLVIEFAASGDGEPTSLGTAEMTGYRGGIDDVVPSPAHTYLVVQKDPVNGNPALGSAELSVTSVTLNGATSSGKLWTVHGSVTATMVPLPNSGDTGSFSVHATF
jgi:hypothetical protein